MKHLSNLLHKLTTVAAVAIALTSCNRAEYATLPKTSSYHGTAARHTPIATPKTTEATVAKAPVTAPEAAVEAAPIVTAPTVAVQPKAVAPEVQPAPAVASKQQAAPKLNFMQKALVQKMVKKADKVANKMQLKKHSEVASTERLSGKLRQGLVLILLGLVLELLGGIVGGSIGSLLYVVGAIAIIIGVVVLVLYLLDEL